MSWRSLARLLLCTALISLASCSPAVPPEAPTPHSLDELKKDVGEVMAKYHIPGVGIALVSKDKVLWTGGVGKADLASGRDVDGDTMFRVGSITKGFVALSLLKLQEQGKISLDAKVSDLAPEVPIANRWERSDPVRVANLLEHTAGFDDFPLAEFYDFSDGPDVPLLQTLQRFPQPQRSRWRPGTIASYSNPGYGVAGYILEKVSAMPSEQYIADNILRPLQMTHSDLRLTPELKGALAQGYENNPPRPVPYLRIYLRSAGELKSSPNEMARFVRMMLNGGELDGVRIVSAESIARMETPKTGLAAKNGLIYGYGLGNSADLLHKFVAHGHDGGLDGFLSSYEYMPEPGVGYFFSINSSESAKAVREIQDLILNYLTMGMTPAAKPAAVPLDSSVKQYLGIYEFAAPREENFKFLFRLLLSGWTYLDHGKLYRRGIFPAAPDEMIYLGNNQSRTKKDLAASAVFCTDQDGTRYGCGSLACFRQTDTIWPVTRFILIMGSILLMASALLFAIIWIPRKLLGRMKGVRGLAVRVTSLLAVLSLAAVIVAGWDQPVFAFVTVNPRTVAIFLATIAFAIFSVVSLVLAMISFSYRMNRVARAYSILVALACFGFTWYLAFWGMIPLRTWTL